VPDFLDGKRREIKARLAELKPVVEEYRRLDAAATALAELNTSPAASSASRSASSSTRRRGRGRPRGSASRVSKKPKAAAKPAGEQAPTRKGRPKGSGKRATEALSLIQGQPGITIPELAAKMGIKQNYLYRVLPRLEQTSKIVKKDKGWHPKD
jgi:hypothetical protein